MWQRCHHRTVFISDDTPRHSFTVRMDNVQESGYYWCAIHIPSAFDIRARFFQVRPSYSYLNVKLKLHKLTETRINDRNVIIVVEGIVQPQFIRMSLCLHQVCRNVSAMDALQ